MPTFSREPSFQLHYDHLTLQEQAAFRKALHDFIEDTDGGEYRASLRVHKIGRLGVQSMSWAKDGRATFVVGRPRIKGKVHIHWLSIGDHGIYDK